ncbi:MAG TPA: hypothetical protein VFF06_06260 [Polyangia bacterium]|nr:hypothetical protein [Polyangia bacterium]
MKTKIKIIIALLLLVTPAVRAEPTITLPPDEKKPGEQKPDGDGARSLARPPMLNLPRESQIEVPLEQHTSDNSTAIGGYGELTVNSPSSSPTVVDLRRMVLYVGHNFTDKFRLYSEFEMEHAVTSSSDKGEFEVEQVFLDYLAWKPINLRAGVIIMPVGIINVYHEPPTFNGVDRPDTDTLVIPSTWREPGAGVFGGWRSLRWQLYAVNGFNATGFTASAGLRDGHQEAQLALGHDWGVVGRVDWAPLLGTNVGVSFYRANADQGQAQFRGSDGSTVPVSLVEADARGRWRGLEGRAEIASVWIGGGRRLNRALAAAALLANEPWDGPVGAQLLGGYVELGYDVLHEVKQKWRMQLVVFGRYEHVDTQFDLAPTLTRTPGHKRDSVTAGLTFRPIAEVALKLDYQRLWIDADNPQDSDVDKFDLGLAFMF